MPNPTKRQTEELENILETVYVNHYIVTTISKVLKLLDRVNDHPAAWKELLDAWKEQRQRADTPLYGLAPGYNILIITISKPEAVTHWAGLD